jgi:hypothetical protein
MRVTGQSLKQVRHPQQHKVWPTTAFIAKLVIKENERNMKGWWVGQKIPEAHVVWRAHCDSEVGELVGTEMIAQPLAEILGLGEYRQLLLPCLARPN